MKYKDLLGGADEVGRGSLFGPVVAAMVVVTPKQEAALTELGVKDSKTLSAKRRIALVPKIESLVTAWAIAEATVTEIDRHNILQATFIAMGRAFEQLSTKPQTLYVDGCQTIPELAIPQEAVIKGDSKIKAIAAASILAKVHRDRELERWAIAYPEYDLANNKGYGTKKHRHAIACYGRTPQHRQSFKIRSVPSQLNLPLAP